MGEQGWPLEAGRSYGAKQWHGALCGALLPGLKEASLAAWVGHEVLAHFLSPYSRVHYVLDTPLMATVVQQEALCTAVNRLQAQEPWQYVLGEVSFLGERLVVGPGVLIPRRETEEMVASLIEHLPVAPKQVLDVGTGSGCIAIALQRAYPKALVEGVDVSEAALAIARENAQRVGVGVNFWNLDFLKTPLPDRKWDLVVSNPPYVLEREREEMEASVLDYEPHGALFVPDGVPLLFYRRLVAAAKKHLLPGGYLCVEINEAFGVETLSLFRSSGLRAVLHQDLQGKDRWILGKKKG